MKEKQKRRKQSTNALGAAAVNALEPTAMEAFLSSSASLQTIIDSLPDAIVIADTDLKVLEVNEAAVRLAGFTRKEDFIGRKGLDFIAPKHIGQVSDLVLNALDRRAEEKVELTIIDASGKEVDVELSVALLNDQAGNLIGFLVAARDITGRRRIEEELRASEARYRELFENMTSGVVVYEAIDDGKDFVFRDFNSVAENVSKLSRKDLIGKSILQTKPGLKKFGLFDTIQKVWQTGKPEHMPVSYYEDEYVSGWRENFIYKLPSGEVVAVYNDITERMRAQEALRQSEEKLRVIFESIKDAVTIVDLKGFIIDANEASVLMGGFSSKDEIIGRNGFDLIVDRDRDRAIKGMELALAKGRTATLEYTLQRKDGSEFDTEASVSFFKDASGKPSGLIAVSRDITERKRIQAALAESEERYRSVVENANEAIVVAQDGMLRFSNPRAGEIMGYSLDELESKLFTEFIYPEDREMVADRYLRRLLGEEVPHTYSFRIIDREGSTKWLDINAVLINWEGRPATLNFLNDITDRKKAVEALRESEEKLRFMFESMGDAIVVIDLKGRVTEVNERLVAMSGCESREQVMNEMPLDSLLRGFALGQWKISPAGERQVSTTVEYVAMDSHGREFDVEASGSVLRNALGKPAGFIIALRDVSDRKRMEKALRESEEKLRFMFESMGDAIVVIDLKGRVTEVNERLVAMSGCESREQVMNEMPLNSLLRGFALGQWKISPAGERQVSTTVEYVAADRHGREFDVEASGSMLRNALGKPSGFIIALRDVSDRKRMEKALRESEEKLRLTIDSMGEMVMLLDLKGNIVDVNPSLMHTMGYSRKEDLIGLAAADLVIESERDKVINYTIESIKRGKVTGKTEYRNLKLKAADGRIMDAEYSINLMHDRNGRLSGVIGVGRDITDRMRAEEAIRRRNIELTAIASVTQSLSQHLRLNRVLQIALDKILEVSGLSVGAIWLLNDEEMVLELAISRGVSNKFIKAVSKMPLDAGITARAVEIGRTVVVTDVQRSKKLPAKYKATAKLEKLRSVVSIPLKSKSGILGAINVFSRERLHFSADVLRLLETMSGQIGIAIDNAQLLEKLSELSKTDELTSLYNRRTFFEMLDSEIRLSSHYSRPFSLVMLDLDSFKIFNDRFGHTSGDAALRKFGAAMKSALRKSDAAFRYGGDEFTIILPATEAKKSRHIIERIRAKWLQAQYNQFPNAEITIDFSVGIAQYPDDTETIDGLIFLADTALLIAKREGGYKSTLVSELGQLPPDVLGTTTLDQVYKLAATVDAKSLYAEGHSRRVAIVAETIGKYMGLDEEQLSQLRVAALLHDIGKIAVPDLIMGKPYGLSKDEKRVVEKHPSEGAKILSHIRELAAIVPVVRHHHEWYNGAGYPDRIKGEDIPFLARILTVADSYDTMTTPLPHKKAMTHEEASEELRRYSGIQFDPEIVEEFCRSVSANEIRRET